MANAVEHNGKVYILNPEPKGDYAEKVGAPYLNQALTDFGLQASPSSSSNRPITNEAVAKLLAQGNPNLTGVNFRTEFHKIELLEVKLPQGLSAADAVKALNNYDPKTNSYIDKDMAAQLTNRKTEELAAKSANNARDISLASGISPHATVTEQLMVNAAKLDKIQYIVTQRGTSFTVEDRVKGHKLNVTAVVDPKFPDRVQLEMSASDYDESVTKFKQTVASKLLDGVLKDTKSSTINAATDFVSKKKIDADITPDKAKKFAEARMESAKGNLVGQNAINEIGIGAMTDQVEKIAPSVRGNSSKPNSAPTGGDTLEDLLQRSGQNDPLHQQHVAADEILRARTLARAEALRAAGHIPEDVSAEEVLKKAGQGASFSQLKEAGQKVKEFKAEVGIAMNSMPESRNSLLDRMVEAEGIAKRVILDREFKEGITILQQSNPHLAKMSEREISSLATGLRESGKPFDIDSFTEAAQRYRTYIDTHAPASTGNALTDVLKLNDSAIKKAALEHAVDSPNRMSTNPVQPSGLLDEIINRNPRDHIGIDAEIERGSHTPTAEDRAFFEKLLKKGMPSQPQVATQAPLMDTPVDTPDPARPTQMTGQQSNSSGHSGAPPSSQSGASSYTATAQPPQIGPQPTLPSGTVMGASNSGSADTSHLFDQTSPAMGHAEVLGATALKPKLQEDLRPDIRETPVVGQVAAAHSASANDPIHTPNQLTNAPSQAPLTDINTSAPAANEPQAANGGTAPAAAPPPAPAQQPAAAQQTRATPPPAAPKLEQAHLDAASQATRAQLADTNYKPSGQTPPSANSSGGLPTGGKIESHTKVAGSGVGIGMGVYGLTQKFGNDGTAAGDLKNKDTRTMAQAGIVADGTAILVDTADSLSSMKKVSDGLKSASKVSRVAAPVSVALSVASGVIDYKIADKTKDASRASDAIGGSAGGMAGAAAGGIVGAKTGAAIGAAVGVWFGGIGAVPAAAVGGFVGGIAGAIGGAFAGAEAGKKVAEVTIKDSIQKKYDTEKLAEITQLKSLPKADLAKSIQTDPTLPHKLNLRGQEVTLVQAMEDKTFRTTFIKGKEEEAKKNPAAQKTVAALKEYAARLEASPQTQQAALKPTTAASPTTPTISAQQVAQYKSMSVNQLGAAIQKDDVLPDRVKISGKEVDLAEALKDKNFRQSMISNMEAAQAKGTDMATQIAMIKTYGEKLDTTTPAAAPLMAANKQKPAIAGPVA